MIFFGFLNNFYNFLLQNGSTRFPEFCLCSTQILQRHLAAMFFMIHQAPQATPQGGQQLQQEGGGG